MAPRPTPTARLAVVDDAEDVEVLAGGVANVGKVVRRGDVVERPADDRSATVQQFLGHVRAAGCDAVPEPLGLDGDTERLRFVAGDVAVPPYPVWVQTDAALAPATALLVSVHRASAGFDPSGLAWNPELADPSAATAIADGTAVMCHNDVCLENVVFRNGRAVALLDWEYLAPGRATWDVAQLARMCVPVDDDVNAARLGWAPADRPARLRLTCDAAGFDLDERAEVLAALDHVIAQGGEFVRRRVEVGEVGFVEMWAAMGGAERFDRRTAWWTERRVDFAAALDLA